MRARKGHAHIAAHIYSNVWEAAREEFDVEVHGGPVYFGLPGWFQVIAPKVACPTCGTLFGALRHPYKTKDGAPRMHWALVCIKCPRVMVPTDLPQKEQGKIYGS